MQVETSTVIMQVLKFCCNFAGGTFCYSHVGGSFCYNYSGDYFCCNYAVRRFCSTYPGKRKAGYDPLTNYAVTLRGY